MSSRYFAIVASLAVAVAPTPSPTNAPRRNRQPGDPPPENPLWRRSGVSAERLLELRRDRTERLRLHRIGPAHDHRHAGGAGAAELWVERHRAEPLHPQRPDRLVLGDRRGKPRALRGRGGPEPRQRLARP